MFTSLKSRKTHMRDVEIITPMKAASIICWVTSGRQGTSPYFSTLEREKKWGKKKLKFAQGDRASSGRAKVPNTGCQEVALQAPVDETDPRVRIRGGSAQLTFVWGGGQGLLWGSYEDPGLFSQKGLTLFLVPGGQILLWWSLGIIVQPYKINTVRIFITQMRKTGPWWFQKWRTSATTCCTFTWFV